MVSGKAAFQVYGETLEGRDGRCLGQTLLFGIQFDAVEHGGKRLPALCAATFRLAQVTRAKGLAQGWKAFTAVLDSVELDAEQERLAEAAAIAAFERFTVHLERCFA